MKFRKLVSLISAAAMAATLIVPIGTAFAADGEVTYTWDFTDTTWCTGKMSGDIPSDRADEKQIILYSNQNLSPESGKVAPEGAGTTQAVKTQNGAENVFEIRVPKGDSASLTIQTACTSSKTWYLRDSDNNAVITMATGSDGRVKNVLSDDSASLECGQTYHLDNKEAGNIYIGKIVLKVTNPVFDEGEVATPTPTPTPEPADPLNPPTENEYTPGAEQVGKALVAPYNIIDNDDIVVSTTRTAVVESNGSFDGANYPYSLPFSTDDSKPTFTNIVAAPKVDGKITVYIGINASKGMYIKDNTTEEFVVENVQATDKGVYILEQDLQANHEYLIYAAGTSAALLKVVFEPKQEEEQKATPIDWDTATETYNDEENGDVDVRYLAGVKTESDVEGTVETYGFKFVLLESLSSFDPEAYGTSAGGDALAFYTDITEVPTDKVAEIFAVPYLVTGSGAIYWGAPFNTTNSDVQY